MLRNIVDPFHVLATCR